MFFKALWSTSSDAAGKSGSMLRTPRTLPWLMIGTTISDHVLRKETAISKSAARYAKGSHEGLGYI